MRAILCFPWTDLNSFRTDEPIFSFLRPQTSSLRRPVNPPPLIPNNLPVSRLSALAVWSLILSLLGILLCFPALGGLILGIVALVYIGKANGALRGRGLAISGIIIGALAPFICGIGSAIVIPLVATKHLREKREKEHASGFTLLDARRGFSTQLTEKERDGEQPEVPPAESGLKLVHYQSPAGKMAAYLSNIPADGRKHPAIVWIFGGISNGIGSTAWEEAPAENDQTARTFREAGVVTLYPSFRGGNDNPGFRETFFGEVEDVLAAADFLAKQPGIDPQRIYLGGHSTGGTLALLAAAASPRFRAVFAFGPVSRISNYGLEILTYSGANLNEHRLRDPENWIHLIHSPTYVLEGEDGNSDSVRALSRANRQPRNTALTLYVAAGRDHFNIIAPLSRQIAKQIITDTGASPAFTFSLGSQPLAPQ